MVTGMITIAVYAIALRYLYLYAGLYFGTFLSICISGVSAWLTYRFISRCLCMGFPEGFYTGSVVRSMYLVPFIGNSYILQAGTFHTQPGNLCSSHDFFIFNARESIIDQVGIL